MVQSGPSLLGPCRPTRTRVSRRTILRKVGLIYLDHRYEATMRDLSQTGARVQGILNVPVGPKFVVDFGGGQKLGAVVRRSGEDWQGIEFEEELTSGNWLTHRKVSPDRLRSEEHTSELPSLLRLFFA